MKSKVDARRSKWNVHGGLTGRSQRLKVDGHISKWTVCDSKRPDMKKWTAQMKLDELYDDDNYPETEVAFNGLVSHFIGSL